MSQAVSAVAVKSNPPVSLASFKAPSAPSAPIEAKPPAAPVAVAAKPATITSIGQSPQPSLGLFNSAGVVAKPAVATAPAAAQAGGATFVAGKDDVTVEIQKSDSGYDNKIYYSTDNFATKHLIGIDNQTGTVNLGKFAEGTKIEFGIQNGANQFFRTGAAATNFDNFQHALTSKNGDGIQIGFEDLVGGGDKDFNDAIITVRSVPAKVVAPPAPSARDVIPKDNRSGLGDGTNPGQGAGRENSPNQGTSNPNNAAPVATAPIATAPVATAPAKAPVATAPPVVAKPAPPVVATQPAPVFVKLPVVAAPPAKSIPPVTAPVIQAKPEPVKVSKPEFENDAKPAPTRESEAEKSSKAAQKAVETAGAVQAAIEEALKTNRSGLGDGSNPGQGAGKASSPNQGTANPGGTILAATPKPVVPVPAAPAKPTATAPVAQPAKPITAAPVASPAKPVAAAPVATASPAPKAPTEAAKTEAAVKDNRSGLGDGTNPGQGAGRTNSPNQGTSNPNNANTTIKPGLKV
ncbi:MAG: DUF4114 domain-containing protein [Herminiimonas sp.]|nr:DUF4114 domain-containing protein [Herminiimonas sp.]